MIRKARAVWYGTGRGGKGNLSSDSGVLADTPYSFSTRFENEKGTNPEELIAAAGARRRAELPGFQGAQDRDHVRRAAGLLDRQT